MISLCAGGRNKLRKSEDREIIYLSVEGRHPKQLHTTITIIFYQFIKWEEEREGEETKKKNVRAEESPQKVACAMPWVTDFGIEKPKCTTKKHQPQKEKHEEMNKTRNKSRKKESILLKQQRRRYDHTTHDDERERETCITRISYKARERVEGRMYLRILFSPLFLLYSQSRQREI